MSAGECTCYMDGSFITDCPTHGEHMRLVREAENEVRRMTTERLRAFLDAERSAAQEALDGAPWH